MDVKKMLSAKKIFFVASCLFMFFVEFADAQKAELTIFFSNDIKGYLEPCG